MSGFYRLPGRSPLAAGVRVLAGSALTLVTSCSSPVQTPSPSFRIEPDTLDFGSLPLDSTRVLTFRLVNTGNGTFPIHPQSSLPAFRVLDVDSAGIMTSPGQGIDVPVAFTPRRAGERAGRLVLVGSDGDAVFCSGWGVAVGRVGCRVEPQELEFGPVRPGEGARLGFGVNNTGTAVLEGEIAVEGAGFAVTSGGGGFRVEPGQWHHVEVEFQPAGEGEASCVVDLGIAGCPAVTGRGYGRGTWRVEEDGGGDAPTVQAAIDSARDGDVVLVGPGRYYENLDLKGKRIHLLGERGRDETILDGSRGRTSVIVCRSGETNDTIIEGFTITGGSGINRMFGGGIYCQSSCPTIRQNRVTRNYAGTGTQATGGGIQILLSGQLGPLVIQGNEVSLNETTQNGGGINVTHDGPDAVGSVLIQNNLIKGNKTPGDGAGIRVWGWFKGSVRIKGNTVVENEAGDHGGGMYLGNLGLAEIEVCDNVIIGNLAKGHDTGVDCTGGGIWLAANGAYIHHNTIAFNRAERSNGKFQAVGGICELNPSPSVIVEHNLIYRNQDAALGVYILTSEEASWHAVFRRNLVYANAVDWVVTGSNRPTELDVIVESMIVADPLFCIEGHGSRGEVAKFSPALNQPWGKIGAVRSGSCGPGIPEKDDSAWGVMDALHGFQAPPNRPRGKNNGSE